LKFFYAMVKSMRIQIKEGGKLIIRLKEENAPYYDEHFCHGWRGKGGGHDNNEVAYGKHKAVIYPYYSEKGELAEIEISTYSGGEDADFYPEVEVPEKLPAKYNVNSELTAVVEEKDNEINFELSSEGEIIQPGQAEEDEGAESAEEGT